MIEESLRYPVQGDGWLQRLAIGGVMLLAGLLVFPAFIVGGYLMEVTRQGLRGDTENPPDWEDIDFGDAAVDGLKLFVGYLGALLVVSLVAGVPVLVLFGVAGAAGSDLGMGLTMLLSVPIGVVGYLGLLVVPRISVANLARTDSVAACFNLDVLWTLFRSGTIWKTFLLWFAVGLI